jgi:exonuclease SbcD
VKTVKLMHFADIHFGIETYGRIDPETGLNTRMLDFRRSLDAAIENALAAGVHLALFAGDAYKTRDPNQTQQREFARCIKRLTESGVPVVMVTGNHDLPNARSRANALEIYRTLGVDNVHILSRPEIIKIDTSAGPVQVAGMPYLLRSTALAKEESRGKSIVETTDLMVEQYSRYIDYLARSLEPDTPSVLLGHFWIKNARVSSQTGYLNVAEPEVLVSTVANPAFDYVAMGHIHKFQDLNKHAHPSVVYCGSLDRIDFSERGEEKGFVLVELKKGSASYSFISTPARRFAEIDVDADVPDPTAAILKSIEEANVEDAVVKLCYHVSEERLPLIREAEVREALADAFMVASVTKDVLQKESRSRNRLLNESLDPMQALEMYFDSCDECKKRKEELLNYTRPLLEELLAEEQV